MSAVKLGYVVRYPNPPAEKGLDTFLTLDTTGPTVKIRTDHADLEKASVFDAEATARHYAAHNPAHGRNAEVCEVHQVTHRKLAVKHAADSIKDFMEKLRRTGCSSPANPYGIEPGLPKYPAPVVRDGVQVQPFGAIPMDAVGVQVGAEAVPGRVETFPKAHKGWPTPSALNFEAQIVPPAEPDNERHIREMMDELPWADKKSANG